jgi:hypothetical protein
MTSPIVTPRVRFFNVAGAPLAGGKLWTYVAGTTTEKASYSDAAGVTPNANPVSLDANGEATVYLADDAAYKFVLMNASNVVQWTEDNVKSIAKLASDNALLVTVANLADATNASKGAGLVGYDRDVSYAVGTVGGKLREWVSVLDYGADPTGVELSNTAFTNAKAVCNTLLLPPGTYRLEGWTAQDVRLIGFRAHGANDGANEQTIIEGSGDIFTGANNFSMENLVIRNTSAGTRGKLISCANIDTKLGPFVQVAFRKATYHVYAADATMALVDVQFERCRFTDASVYSRYYEHGLFGYEENQCYTQANQRGLYIRGTSSAAISGVFEFNEEGAIYVENTAVASDVIRGLRLHNIHFEQNGDTTPTADVTINVTQSLARISFDSCGFYSPTVIPPVECSSSPTLRMSVINCKDISFDNLASTSVVAWIAPKQSGLTNAFYAENGDIGTDGMVYATNGFRALGGISQTITSSATATPVAVPAAGTSRLVLVCDSTTEGAALLLLTNTAVSTVLNGLTSVTFDVSGGFLRGTVTGGASSRVLFFNFMAT